MYFTWLMSKCCLIWIVLQERNTLISKTPSTIDLPQNIDENACKEARKKLEYVMHELINTEEQYVNDLGLVVNGYMAVMANPKAAGCKIPIPLDFLSNSSIYNLVFVNIKHIHKWHSEYASYLSIFSIVVIAIPKYMSYSMC